MELFSKHFKRHFDLNLQMAFDAVMYLWNKKPLKGYGSRMTESILAILCHIIKGEPVIKVT
jgi:E3 ubiquitin-protein ligase HUWE1